MEAAVEVVQKSIITTFIEAKLKKSNDQTTIGKYRVATNITENYIKIKLLRITIPKFMKNMFIKKSKLS